MNRVKVVWAGWPGAPGYSNFYLNSTVLDPTPIRTFFEALKSYIPIPITIQVPGSGDSIDSATGAILGTWVGTTPAVVTATGPTATGYAGASGAVVEWLTGTVIGRRRPLGKTYIVPLNGDRYDNSGNIFNATLTVFQTAAAALVTALGSDFRVWHRPVGGTGGVAVPVVASRVPDLAAVLKSRRQ